MSEFIEQFIVQVFSIGEYGFHGIVFNRNMRRIEDRMVLFPLPKLDISIGDELYLTSHKASLHWSMSRKALPSV